MRQMTKMLKYHTCINWFLLLVWTTFFCDLILFLFPGSYIQHPFPKISTICPNLLRPTSLTLPLNQYTSAVPVMYSFLILSILFTHNEDLQLCQTIHHSKCHHHLVNPPFQSCCYPSVTNDTCLHSLHPSSYSTSFFSWHPVICFL